MSGTGTGIGHMTLEPKHTCHICNLRYQAALEKDSDLSPEDKSSSAPFQLLANEWLAFWLLLMASSVFLFSRNLKFIGNCRVKAAKKEVVSFPKGIYSNAKEENDATCHKCDEACYSEICDFDRTSYFDSLLSLEDEDSEWLSDSNPSTPLSCCKYDSLSDRGSPSYWNSLLGLEEKDSDRAIYFDSLLSLEDEDTEWLSDSKSYGFSSEDPASASPFSYKSGDSLSEISDIIGSPFYWNSLLGLEENDSESISDSTKHCKVLHPISFTVSSNTTRVQCSRSEDNVSLDTEEYFSADEPLFWPFEKHHNWNSEENWSSFCSSPRRRLVFESNSPTPKKKECKEKFNDDDALCSSVKSEISGLSMWSKSSAKILDYEDDLSKSTLLDDENFGSDIDLLLASEYFDLDQGLPIETLVGLKEFDGHEGLDSEFDGDVFMQLD
ncbi:hypothetical protein RIF29_27917 [Crotalaria pallida]|uniref:Uncharacterized protein n=1 Tax=Crotalaria pallida TaxID=3830 RepID=A0AAN9EPZ2_CROPI